MKTRALLSLFLVFISGCMERAPVSKHEANIYQAAVYYNAIRPSADKQRDQERKPAEVLAFSGLKPGSKVIDLLGGGGWYTELLSNVVGENGHVYIVNTPLFLNFSKTELEGRLQGQRLKNVTRIDAPWDNLDLPLDIDYIWLALSYHDIYVKRPPEKKHFEADRNHFFAQLRKSLKPGGFLLLTDHAATPNSGIDDIKLHRIDEDFTRRDMETEGFLFIRSSDLLRNPGDDHTKDIWNKQVARKTDRFVHLYQHRPNF